MYRYLLNKKFFKDNPVKELTSQRLIYSSILMPEVEVLAQNVVIGLTDSADEETVRIKEEKMPK